ncbi:hypothetical protein [Burkholderia aenigmatica]|uniref:hypothetical protein n=1 Tax=Burkholderia aenigmatica TaxID=2015348 RepID=UPI001581600A|nr:hypothetical protein [Burkholderia aenigmatica]
MKIPYSRKTLVGLRTVGGMPLIAAAQALGIPLTHRKQLETVLRPLSAAILVRWPAATDVSFSRASFHGSSLDSIRSKRTRWSRKAFPKLAL